MLAAATTMLLFHLSSDTEEPPAVRDSVRGADPAGGHARCCSRSHAERSASPPLACSSYVAARSPEGSAVSTGCRRAGGSDCLEGCVGRSAAGTRTTFASPPRWRRGTTSPKSCSHACRRSGSCAERCCLSTARLAAVRLPPARARAARPSGGARRRTRRHNCPRDRIGASQLRPPRVSPLCQRQRRSPRCADSRSTHRPGEQRPHLPLEGRGCTCLIAQPLLGLGGGTFQVYWTQLRTPQGAYYVTDTHELYLQSLGELGVLGLALHHHRRRRHPRGYRDAGFGAQTARCTRRCSPPSSPGRFTAPWIGTGRCRRPRSGCSSSADWPWPVARAGGASATSRATAPCSPSAGCSSLSRHCSSLSPTPACTPPRPTCARATASPRASSALSSLSINAERPDAYSLIGLCDLEQGFPAAAVPAMSKAASLDPQNWQEAYWLAVARAARRAGPASRRAAGARAEPARAARSPPRARAWVGRSARLGGRRARSAHRRDELGPVRGVRALDKSPATDFQTARVGKPGSHP